MGCSSFPYLSLRVLESLPCGLHLLRAGHLNPWLSPSPEHLMYIIHLLRLWPIVENRQTDKQTNRQTKERRTTERKLHTISPRSSEPFYTVTYYINWVTIFWTYIVCILQKSLSKVLVVSKRPNC